MYWNSAGPSRSFQWVNELGAADIPRLSFDALPAELQKRLSARVDRLGYLGEFFQVAAHQPEALGHFVDYTENLKKVLPPNLTETIALSIASASGNRYELVQHKRLARALGLSPDLIAGILTLDPTDPRLSPEEQATAALAHEVLNARGRSCAASFEPLVSLVGAGAAIACLMTAVRYLSHATMANTWGLSPPVPDPDEPVGDV